LRRTVSEEGGKRKTNLYFADVWDDEVDSSWIAIDVSKTLDKIVLSMVTYWVETKDNFRRKQTQETEGTGESCSNNGSV
jgi:hypothetical protein